MCLKVVGLDGTAAIIDWSSDQTAPGGVWVVVCCSETDVRSAAGKAGIWAHMDSCVRSRSDWLIS